ncbi:hypothetical protein DV515_00007989, partial [Chloebia gouldiae]
ERIGGEDHQTALQQPTSALAGLQRQEANTASAEQRVPPRAERGEALAQQLPRCKLSLPGHEESFVLQRSWEHGGNCSCCSPVPLKFHHVLGLWNRRPAGREVLGMGTALSTGQVLGLEELILCLDMVPILDQVNRSLAACSDSQTTSINILAYWHFQETEAKTEWLSFEIVKYIHHWMNGVLLS